MLRNRLLLPALLAILSAILPAQEISVKPGTQIPVELRTKLKTESVKVGARIEFRTIEAVLIGHNIVVPEDATVIGRVDRIVDDAPGSPGSLLRIAINTLKWKHNEAPLNAVIISVERTPAQDIMMLRSHRYFRSPPTFLKDIHIRAHLARNAVTEFYSDHPNFTVDKGLFFLLRQVDPDHEPTMAGKDHVLNVGPQN